MNLEEIMRGRRTVRRFKKQHVSRADVERLIELAVTAPSAGNRQPWRFFITDDPSLIEHMARAVQTAVDCIAAGIDPAFTDAFRNYGDYFVRFREAPLVIAPAFTELTTLSNMISDDLPMHYKNNINAMEFNSGLMSVSLAVQNLLLAAHEHGFGTSVMTGPLTARYSLKKLLNVPESWEIAALVALGYPDEVPEARSRKNITSIIRWSGFAGFDV